MKGILKVAPIYTYDNTTIKFWTLGGCYTSRHWPKNSKTYGEGISSLQLTVFELWPKNWLFGHFGFPICFLQKIKWYCHKYI